MKLQAVMENLQRQQRARLQQELEARQQEQQRSTPPPPALPPPPPSGQNVALPAGASQLARGRSQDPAPPEEGVELESARIQRAQMAALAAMRAAAAGLSHSPSPGMSDESQASEEEEEEEQGEEEEEEDGRYQQEMGSEEEEELKRKWDEDDFEEDMEEDEEEEEEEEDYEEDEEMGEDEGLGSTEAVRSGPGSLLLRKPQAPQQYRGEPQRLTGGQERLSSGLSHQGHLQLQQQAPDHGDWTYEEQFKQLYELDGDPKRKEFLDDLFSFMQKRASAWGLRRCS